MPAPRGDLRRHEALVVAAEEWEASGRNPDYVFGGSRLREYEPWLDGGIMQLSGRERAFLEAGLELRRSGEAIAAARAEIQRRLERRARARLIGLGGVVALLAAAVTFAALVGLGRPPARVGLSVWGGGTLDQIISSGFDRGVTDFGLTAKKVIALDLADPEADWEPAVRALVEESPALMVLTNLPAFVVNDFVRDYPNVRFAAVDVVASEPNVESLSFAEAEGAFLAGVAAARTSKTGTIGFVGGMEFEVIWRFHAGYEAGARAYDPDIQVLVAYLSEDDPSGFQDAAGALSAARQMYSSGADVILHAAGDAGLGVFEAAADMSAGAGRQLWVIGVDTDQHETVTSLPGALRAAAWQPHILTSVVKRLDQAVYLALRDVAEGRFVAGPRGYGLASGLLDLSYSGGFIDGIRPEIERYKAQIVAGAIPIPCVPSDRLEAAREQGISPADCGAR